MDRETQVENYFGELEKNAYAFDALARLSQIHQSDLPALVRLLAARAEDYGPTELGARLLLEAGALSLRLGDSERAGVFLDQASSASVNTPIAPEARLYMLAYMDKVEELFAFFGESVETLPDGEMQGRLYFQMGRLLEFMFEDLVEAQQAYTWSSQLGGTGQAATWALQGIFKKKGEWEAYAELLYNEVQETEDVGRQLDALLDLGDVYKDHLDQTEGAAQCYASVFEYDAGNERARAALETLGYELPPTDGEGFDLESEPEELDVEALEEASDDNAFELESEVQDSPAEPSQESEQNFELESELEEDSEIVAPAEVAPEDVASEAELSEAELSEADVDSDAGSADEESDEQAEESEASEAADESADDESEDEISEAADAVAAPASVDTGWEDRFRALLRQAEDGDALDSLTRAVRLAARHNAPTSLFERVWQDALALDLGRPFWDATHFEVADHGLWNSVIESADDPALQGRIALVNLGDTERAATFDAPEVAELLADYAAGEANWRKLQREIEGRHTDVDKDEQARLTYMRLADIAHASGDEDKEMDALRRLDRQLKDDMVVKARLKRIYGASEKWPMFVDILKAEVAAAEDDNAEKLDLLHAMVVVYRDHMNHDMMVVNTYKEILEIEPGNLAALDALVALYDKLNRSSELINTLQTKADLVEGDAAQVEIWSQIAALFLDRFRNQAEAIKAYERVLEIEKHNAAAIEFLKEMYAKRRDWEKLIDVHKLEIETLESDDEKAAGLKEVAQLATDKLRNAEVASELWIAVREYAPDDHEALDALEKLYEKNKDFAALGSILEKKAELEPDEATQLKLYGKLAPIYSERLGDVDSGVRIWRRCLSIAPDDLKARKSLEKLFIDNGRWDELESFYGESEAWADLVRLLETLANTVKEDETKIELLVRAAVVWRERLNDTSRAERDLGRVLEIDPRNEWAAIQLEPIHEEAGEWDKVRHDCEIVLSYREDVAERRPYQLKLAALQEEHLGSVDAAFGWYLQAFTEDTEFDGVVADLERTAARTGKWESVVAAYEQAVSSATTDDSRRKSRLRLGRVLSEEMGQYDEALAHFQTVLDEDSENQTALSATADIYQNTARWDDLMSVFQRQIELTDAPAERVKILSGMALIAENQAGDIEGAIRQYNEALAIDPEYEPSLQQLHRLYREESKYDELASIIRREIALIEKRAIARTSPQLALVDTSTLLPGSDVVSPAEAAGFDSDLSYGLGESSSDVDGLSESSSDVEGLGEESSSDVEGLEESSSDVEESADADLEEDSDADGASEASEFEDEERTDVGHSLISRPTYTEDEIDLLVSLHFELGLICQTQLGEDSEAVDSLALVLAWRPNHEDARAAIETYLNSDAYKLRVASVLEPVYTVQGAWDDLVGVLEVQNGEAEHDGSVALLERIATTYVAELGRPDAAFTAWGRLVSIEPGHEKARHELFRIADALEDWEGLVDLYEGVRPTIDDAGLRIDYDFTIGDVYADRLHDPESARKAFEAVLETDPSSDRALDELEDLYTRTENWDELKGVLARKLELSNDATTTEGLRFRKALLWDEKLDDRGQSIAIYQSILDDNPSNLGAIAELNRLYGVEGRWEEMSQNLEHELELCAPEHQTNVKNRLAFVLEQHLEGWERAVDLYEEVLAVDPTNQFALESMQRLMYEDSAPQSRISTILEPIYLELDAWEHVVAALEVQAETSEDAESRVTLMHRIAALHEARGQDPSAAFDTFARALHFGVDDEQTLSAIYRLGQSIPDGYTRLVDTFENEAQAQESPEVKRDMLRRAAAVHRDGLSDMASATTRLHEVLEIFPDDLETTVELEGIYRATQDWGALVSILVAKAELVEDGEEKVNLLHQAGTMYEDFLEEPLKAIDVYTRALELDAENAHSIDRLEVLYREQELWDELLAIYERKVSLASSDELRKDLYYAMGAIYRQALAQPHDAIEVFRKVLEIEPSEVAAWVQLDELFEETEQWNELLETLDAELMLATLPEESQNLKYRIGKLWETHLYDVTKAVDTYRQVLVENPAHEPTTAALEGLISSGENEAMAAEVLEPIYRESGEWEKLIHIYRLLIEASNEPERKIDLYTEVGTTYEHRLHDLESAFDAFTQALSVDPLNDDTLNTLERIAAQLEAWPELVERLDAQIDDTSDFAAIRKLHVRIARIQEEEMADAQASIQRFSRVLEMEPADEESIISLDRLYQREGQWEDLAEILRTRIMNSDDADDTLQLRLRLGQLFQTALEDEEQALEVYQNILLDDGENPQAIASLEQMFMSGQAVQQVAGILEPFYSSRDQHDKLVEIYVQRLEMIEEPSERFDVWMLVASTFMNELGDQESALASFGKALFEKPDDEGVIEQIRVLAEETNNWQPSAQLLIDALDSPQIDEESSMGIFLALAQIFDENLGMIDQAENAYLNVLELDDSQEQALAALDRIYEHQARWEDLASIIQRRIEGVYDEDEIIALNYRLAQLYQTQLGNLDGAVATYRTILDIQPAHLESLQMLERIFYQQQAWSELYDVMERESEVVEDPEDRARLYSQMAKIAEEMLDRSSDAVDLWNRVLSIRDDDVEALQQLRRLYLNEERWQDLVTVLEREVELSHDPDEQLTLYQSLGTIFGEKLGNEGQSLEAWRKVLELEPMHLDALEALRDLHTRAAEYTELADVLYRMLDHEALEHERKLELWKELGQIQGEMLMQPEQAIDAWKHVLSYEPGNRDAIESLEQLFLQEARWEEAAQVLELKLDTVDDIYDRVDLLIRIADIWETKIVDRDRAAQYYEVVLQLDPLNEQAGSSLEQIYREQGTVESFQALATLYLDRADNNAEDPDTFLEARRQSARVFEEHLQQMEGAFLVLVTAFRADTIDDQDLLVELERYAAETGQWGDLVAEVQKVLHQLDDSPESADLHRKAGSWLAERMGQPDDAVYHLQRALMIEPENVEVMDVLEGLYRQIGAWPELSQVLQNRVELTLDPDEQAEIWRKLGELYEMQMGQIDDAIAAYRRILDIDPSDILAIESLERIYEAYDRWDSLIEILSQKAEATYDPDQIVAIRFRVAQIWEERLGNIDEAIATYRLVLEVDQSNSAALGELERLYMATQNWNELLDVFEQQLQLTHEPAEQIVIYSKMATLYEDQWQDLDRGIEAYNNILMVAPENLDAIHNLERLYEGREQWFDLAEVLQRHADVLSEQPDSAAQVLTRLGVVQRDFVSDPNAAIDAFNRSLQANPNQPEAWEAVANLYDETANWDASIEALGSLAQLSQDPQQRVEILHRIGFMWEANLQNDDQAEVVFQQGLELVPTHEPTILALRDLYHRRGDWQSVVRVLKHAEEVARDLPKKAEYLCQIGQVYRQQLQDDVSAMRYFEAALENDPSTLDAAEPLIDSYYNEQRWERAAPLLAQVLERRGERDPEEMHRRFVQMARVSMELGREENALQAFRDAYEMDPTDTETLKGLSELLYRREEWEQSFKIFQAIQFNHLDKLSNTEAVDVFYKSGIIKQRAGEPRKAIQMFQKALEWQPEHLPSLNALVENYESENNWGEVVNCLQMLASFEEADTVRFAHLSRIGDIWMQKLGDPGSATRAYLEALDLDTGSVVILRKLLDIYTKTSQWNEAVEILGQLIEQEQDMGRKAKYLYTVGVLYRDEIHDLSAAVETFDSALDVDVKMLKAFEAIDRILTDEKAWKELERAYRRMLRRVTERDDGQMEGIKILLWQNLGEIYRSRLGHMKSAIQAYEAAVGLSPGDEKIRLILAELYERSDENPDGAIQQHKELIKLDPFRIESYRALWKSYMQKKEYDRAWCMAGALSFLQNANDQEEKFYRQYLGQNLRLAKGQFNPEMLKLVYHPDQDMLISMIMSILGQGLLGYYGTGNVKDWGLHKRKDILSPDEQLMFCKIYAYASRAEQVMPAPAMYLKRDQAYGMRNANTNPPSFVIGGDMMQGKTDRELAFTIAKQLCLVRPEHYLASVPLPTEGLKMLFMGAMHLADPSLGIGATLGENGPVVMKEIQRMPQPMQLQLQKYMKSYLTKGENPNLSKWLMAVDYTTTRMGLLLCGDIHMAASAIKNDMNPIGKASVKDKIREMVLFSISDEYFALRQQLGLSIENR